LPERRDGARGRLLGSFPRSLSAAMPWRPTGCDEPADGQLQPAPQRRLAGSCGEPIAAAISAVRQCHQG